MLNLAKGVAVLATLMTGAIFGFFYAYYCSVMWGLDVIDPRDAIRAMQGINVEVRNIAFFPAFFLTPVVMTLAAGLAWRASAGWIWFAAAAVVYAVGGIALTASINVPMNNALAVVDVSADVEAARAIWVEYSERWQVWNAARMVASAVALGLALIGLLRFPASVRN